MLEKMSIGNLTNRLEFESNNEIGKMAQSVDQLIASMKNKVQVAEEIAKGNLDVRIDLASDKDMLGTTFQTMLMAMTNKVDVANSIAKGDLDVR